MITEKLSICWSNHLGLKFFKKILLIYTVRRTTHVTFTSVQRRAIGRRTAARPADPAVSSDLRLRRVPILVHRTSGTSWSLAPAVPTAAWRWAGRRHLRRIRPLDPTAQRRLRASNRRPTLTPRPRNWPMPHVSWFIHFFNKIKFNLFELDVQSLSSTTGATIRNWRSGESTTATSPDAPKCTPRARTSRPTKEFTQVTASIRKEIARILI